MVTRWPCSCAPWGHVLRHARQRRAWSLAQTGALVGFSESVMCRLESGQRLLNMRRLVVSCATLGVTPAELVGHALRQRRP